MSYKSVHTITAEERAIINAFAQDCPYFGYALCGSNKSDDLWKSSWTEDAPKAHGLADYVERWADDNFDDLVKFAYAKDQKQLPMRSEFVNAWRINVDTLIDVLGCDGLLGAEAVVKIFFTDEEGISNKVVNKRKAHIIGMLRLLAWTHHIQVSKQVSDTDIKNAVHTSEVQARTKKGDLKFTKAGKPVMKKVHSYPQDPRQFNTGKHCLNGIVMCGTKQKHTITIPEEMKAKYTSPVEVMIAQCEDTDELEDIIRLAKERLKLLDGETEGFPTPAPQRPVEPASPVVSEASVETPVPEEPASPAVSVVSSEDLCSEIVNDIVENLPIKAPEERVYHGHVFRWHEFEDRPNAGWMAVVNKGKRRWTTKDLERDPPNKAMEAFIASCDRQKAEAEAK